jgi:cold shock protein
MSSDKKEDTSVVSGKTTGCVKWFNNKQGYGFINITAGENTGTDIFVHHSAIQVAVEQYKYLVQGEYVQFDLCKADAGSHKWQAGNIRGLENGKLMCETRHDTRSTSSYSGDSNRQNNYSNRTDLRKPSVRVRGQGPREGEEWLLIRRQGSSNRSNNREYGERRERRERRERD